MKEIQEKLNIERQKLEEIFRRDFKIKYQKSKGFFTLAEINSAIVVEILEEFGCKRATFS
jgi:CBS-domain-containing membrane protein